MYFQLNSFFLISFLSFIDVPRIFADETIPPITSPPITAAPVTSAPVEQSPKSDFRCGVTEHGSRQNCGRKCTFNSECEVGEYCWGTFPSFCYLSDSETTVAEVRKSDYRCGVDEVDSRTNCGKLCTLNNDCGTKEFCWSTFANKCYLGIQQANARQTNTELLPRSDFRCGLNEFDSRTNCGTLCTTNNDCGTNEYCWGTFSNRCYISELNLNNSVPNTSEPVTAGTTAGTTDPLDSSLRCGIDERDARENCGKMCVFSSECGNEEYCWRTFVNTCPTTISSSQPTTTAPTTTAPTTTLPTTASPTNTPPTTASPVTTTVAPLSTTISPTNTPPTTASPVTPTTAPLMTTAPITAAPITLVPITPAPILITSAPVTAGPVAGEITPSPISSFPPRSDYRCGMTEEDSRTNCGLLCTSNGDCDLIKGEYCWTTFPNKCYLPVGSSSAENNLPTIPEDAKPKSDFRCGTSEADARGNCKKTCLTKNDCESDEFCYATLPNFCYTKD